VLIFSPESLSDLERIFEFNEERDEQPARGQLERIRQAILILDDIPHVGRLLRGRVRELVISDGKTGFVALYRSDETRHRVEVLGIRLQREAGYRGR
jgi:plasmid stabilization system protein ParE